MQHQVHDFSPPLPPSGLFWTVPVAPESVRVDLDQGTAILRVPDLEVPDWGNVKRAVQGAAHRASHVSFDVRWHDVLDRAPHRNAEQHWGGDYIQTEVSIEWSARQDGFDFISDARQTSRTDAGILGTERSGSYFG